MQSNNNPPLLNDSTSPPASSHDTLLQPATSQQQQHQQQQQQQQQPFPPAPSYSSSSDFPLSDPAQQPLFMSPHQQHPSGTLSTPEAHWSASSNLSSAPALTLASSEALDQGSIFDSFNRPYTPSYNSASGFEGAFSDQDDFWSGTGSHFEEAEFAFGQPLSKGQNSLSVLAYDPETADNYNNLDSVLLAASSFGQGHSSTARSATSSHLNNNNRESTGLSTLQFADQKNFREPDEKSPIASPLLGATSPVHTRHSSFGAHLDPTPALDTEQAWMQSLGQRISLNNDSGVQSRHLQQHQQQGRYHHRHAASLQDFSGHSQFAPVFEEEGQSVDQSDYSGQHFPSYTYSQIPPGSQYEHNLKHSEVGDTQLPLLAISDTTMQDAAFSQASRAPDGRTWAEAGNWNPSANDYYPLSYSNGPQNNMGDVSNSSTPAPPPSFARPGNPTEGPHQGKRQDSYEQIRKFLRLDVDMGFVSQQQQHHLQEPGSLMASRKRSNSDFGPSYFGGKDEEGVTSPPLFTVFPDGVTDKTPVALTSGVDWVTEAARQRKLQAQDQGDMRSDAVVMTMQPNYTMDPNLLLQQQQYQHMNYQSRYNPASGPMRQRDVSNLRGASGPYQHDRTSSSGSSAATPWVPVSPTVPAASAAPNANSTYASLGNSSGQSQLSAMRRSHSASRHRRGAQSEDLSQLARSSNPTEFLHRITAPDGSLAPPNAHTPTYANPLGGPLGNISTPASRLNPAYQTSHDRSGGSNHSTPSSIESNDGTSEAQERQAAMNRYRSNSSLENAAGNRKNYSQTALPTYSSLLNNIGDPNPMQTMMARPSNGTAPFPYPVAQVTTTATQAASASRRKNEAIHVCPIPGCGSTFTRKFNLNGHIRSHTGARPYECREPGCGKSFARSFDLSRHEKLHAGIKPHNCESCGKSFARADALSRHLRNDAGNGGCSARFNEDGEEEGDARMTPSNSTPAIRLRSGSSASSSLDSMDESYRRQEDDQQNQRSTDADPSLVKRESRFKGYVL